MASASKIGASRWTSREDGPSRAGSPAGWAAVSVAGGTPRRCRNDLWDQVGSAKVSVAAFAVASGVGSAAVTEAIGVSAAATMAAAVADSVEDSVEAGAATVTLAAAATLAAAEVVMAADRTVTLHRTLPTDPAVVTAARAAVTGETSPVRAVGMAVTVVVAHMMTGPEATEATVAAATEAATGTLGRRAATWSRCAHAETTDTAEVETTTDPGMTTHASAATTAVTRIPGSCGATDRTIPKMSCGGYLGPFSSSFRLRLLLHLYFPSAISPLPPGVSLFQLRCERIIVVHHQHQPQRAEQGKCIIATDHGYTRLAQLFVTISARGPGIDTRNDARTSASCSTHIQSSLGTPGPADISPGEGGQRGIALYIVFMFFFFSPRKHPSVGLEPLRWRKEHGETDTAT